MSATDINPQDACGCCAGTSSKAPAEINNRPGLSAIAYRIGTHSEVLDTLKAGLSSKAFAVPETAQENERTRPLEKLRTRDSDDFSIALLDAYACMADVLSFYQERIANESYLNTATERFSLNEMARLIGYRLKPGVAAETYLAFTLQEPPPQAPSTEPKQASGVPDKVTLDAGIKVQSIPGPDEKPQTFETIGSIEARPEWNVLLPKMHEKHLPAFDDTDVYLKGTATNLKVGDALLFVGSERENDTGNENWDFRRVQSVVIDNAANRTKVTLDHGLGSKSPHVKPAAEPKVYALRQCAALFGHNAPDWRVMSDAVKRGYLGLDSSNTEPISATEWPDFTIADIAAPPVGKGLYGEYFASKDLTDRRVTRVDAKVDFDWATGSPDALIGTDNFSVRWTGWVQAPSSGTFTFYTHSDDGVRLWVNNQLIIQNWTQHGTTENSGAILLTGGTKYPIKLEYFEQTGAATIKLLWSPPKQAKQVIPQERLYLSNANVQPPTNTLHLDALYPQIMPGSWLVLSIPGYQELYQVGTASEDARASFTLTSKTTRLTLKGENLLELFNERLRETAVFAHSEALELDEKPITLDVSGDSLRVNRKVEDMPSGRKLILSGTTPLPEAKEMSEELTLLRIDPGVDTSTLFFTTPLQNQYQRESVRLYANVALATHGETVHETLGSGAARLTHQRFALKHAPLTYVGADNETGAEAALEVRVNDILWHQAPSLYNAGAKDRSYVLRVSEDGAGSIQFGDGRRGTRLPTGSENVRAIYRKGIGSVGNLKAGQLSQLLSRPLGLKAVSNPRSSEGGVDADSADHARRTMPLGVRTLGRVVSILDYEDFARAFTGIAKAKATVLNTRAGRTVFISVAGDKGVQPMKFAQDKLLNALKLNGDPLVYCELAAYQLIAFRIALRIKCVPDYDSSKVLLAVEAALRNAFSFEARDFGQSVSQSEIIAVAQEVEGVLGVDLDSFYRSKDSASSLQTRLTPAGATVDKGMAIAAELLVLDTQPFDSLKEML